MTATATEKPLKPHALPVDPEAIPRELKDLVQWVAWQYQYDHERCEWAKVPVNPKAPMNGPGRARKASSTDARTWGTFEQAWEAYQTHPPMVGDVPAPDDPDSTGNGGHDGIGLVLHTSDPYLGIDLDKCLKDGQLTDTGAMEELELLAGTYTEVSPSGTGLRAFCVATKPGTRSKTGTREMYDGRDANGNPGGRFLTVTGHTWGEPCGITEKQDEVNVLYPRWFTKEAKAKPNASTSSTTGAGYTSSSLDDDALFERMFASKNGAAIKALWDGDTSAYGSDSEADLALVSHLGFWFGYDPTRVDEQYRRSGLYRPKWDAMRGAQTYGQRTIDKAIEGKGRGDGYSGGTHNDDQSQEVDPERIARKIDDFPLGVYPEGLVRFIEASAVALPAPPDFVAVPMLGVLGAAIGISREIKLKESWKEGARFFTATIADPGSKKSPALALATAPLKELQRAYSKKHRTALDEYERKKQEYERAKTQRGKGDLTLEPPGDPPKLAQCLTTDATVEALMSLHVENPRSLMLYQDELSAWVTGMGQYKGGKGSDLQKWLSIWGGSQVIVNRKGKQAEQLDDPFINVSGCIPPDILPTLETSEGSDGFIDRILFCYPKPVRPTFDPKADIPQALADEYQAVFNNLRKLEPMDGDGITRPKTLAMTPEAMVAFTEWANDHFEEMAAPDFDRRLRGAWAKLEGYCARFALVLHLTAYVAGEESGELISVTSIYKAATLTDYFKSHAIRVYGQLKGTELSKALSVVYEYIDRQPKRRCMPRDLTRAGLPGCGSAKSTKALLQKLTDAGLGRFEPFTYPNGRKGEVYVLVEK